MCIRDSHYDSVSRQTFYRHRFSGFDQETESLLVSGTYTLVLDGRNDESDAPTLVSFTLHKVPQNSPVALDPFLAQPAPDLMVTSLTLNPAHELQTGQTIDLQWRVENHGLQPTSGCLLYTSRCV